MSEQHGWLREAEAARQREQAKAARPLAEVVRSAILRVAENVVKHTVTRSGFQPNDACFLVDLRESERELIAALEQAKLPQCAECTRLREQLAEWEAARESLERARELVASAARYLESALSVVPKTKGVADDRRER